MKISTKLFHQYTTIFLNFSPTSNHLHALQVENYDSNSRLVVDEDDNGKLRPEWVHLSSMTTYIHITKDISFFRPEAVDEFFGKPIHNFLVDNGSCLSRPCCILRLDMKTLKVEQLGKVKCVFDTEIKRSGVMHVFASWFSVDFCSLGSDGKNVTLDTAPTEE